MFLLEASGIKKYFGDRCLLDINDFKIYIGDKIGLVGENGCGKTTFLKILTGEAIVDEGTIKSNCDYRYIPQFDDGFMFENYLSGGEKTKLKINEAFASEAHLLIADEPTSNLDIHSVEDLQRKLKNFNGALLIISHDRKLLNAVCNKIAEIENSKITIYNGNYDDYKKQKDLKIERQKFEYEQYIDEKKRLKESLQQKKESVSQMRHTPKRMGISEARLHRGGSSVKKSVEKKVKSLETRIQKLEVKDRVKEKRKQIIDVVSAGNITSRYALKVTSINQSFGLRQILNNVSFQIEAGSKTVLIGANGTGKTTLIKKIISSYESGEYTGDSIWIAPTAKIAYFSQSLNILDEDKTVFDNVAEGSRLSPTEIRTIFARLNIRRSGAEAYVSELSGGEKVKVSLAKIFAKNVNFLILDEPTNYLDIYVMEALEEMIQEYAGTVLVVTHDRTLLEKCADTILSLEKGSLSQYNGTYPEYIFSQKSKDKKAAPEDLLRLENQLAYVISRLSLTPPTSADYETLDSEYRSLISEIKKKRPSKR